MGRNPGTCFRQTPHHTFSLSHFRRLAYDLSRDSYLSWNRLRGCRRYFSRISTRNYGPLIVEIVCCWYHCMDRRRRLGVGGPELVPEAPARGGGRHPTEVGTGSWRSWRDEGGRQSQPPLQEIERKGEVDVPAYEDTVVPQFRGESGACCRPINSTREGI